VLWKLGAGAGALALAFFLVWVYGNSREHAGKLEERGLWKDAVEAKNIEISSLKLENAARLANAAVDFANQMRTIDPVIIRSTSTIREFRETDSGRTRCLEPERVFGIEQDAAALGLYNPVSTRGSQEAVPVDTAD